MRNSVPRPYPAPDDVVGRHAEDTQRRPVLKDRPARVGWTEADYRPRTMLASRIPTTRPPSSQ